ncbi:MAG: deoxyguanosinetriphosphate triphosphohydrolase [Clostridia bacterium]
MENIKLYLENLEKTNLSQYAQLSCATRGREYPAKDDFVRAEFQRDRDKIIHCKAFRRLKHKTQVFLSPEGDHYRTRLTHTLEVSQIGRTIARALRLNEDLTEACTLGHDLGHTPFGHAGEATLDKLVKGGFMHNKQSRRVVEILENNGAGLNLTYEVRDGIEKHKYTDIACTLEGQIVKFADRFAYINHDIEDATRGGIISASDLPRDCVELLGDDKGERINRLIVDVLETSFDKPFIAQSQPFKEMTEKLHAFMFENVYYNPKAKKEEAKAKEMLAMLFDYYMRNVDQLPDFHRAMLDNTPLDRVVCDYVSSFTDSYCIAIFRQLFIPGEWNIL